MIQELQADGTKFAKGTEPKIILTSEPTIEKGTVEGPFVVYKEPFYYLFHSSNSAGGPYYYVGVARSQSVMGPYEEWDQKSLQLDERNFQANNVTFVGPGSYLSWFSAFSDLFFIPFQYTKGHCSVVQTSPNQMWMVYHAWHVNEIGHQTPGRMMLIDKINWTEDKWPKVGFPSDKPTAKPVISDI